MNNHLSALQCRYMIDGLVLGQEYQIRQQLDRLILKGVYRRRNHDFGAFDWGPSCPDAIGSAYEVCNLWTDSPDHDSSLFR